jgi:sulfur-carrier protein adenylyltransferase/sulfurtransferase
VAAQLLSGQGFEEIYNLKGGMQAWQGLTAKGAEELNLDLITGEESPVRMIIIAYGLEEALEHFYLKMIDREVNREINALLKTLWAVEERHKKILGEHYQRIKTTEDQDLLMSGHPSGEILEGGFLFSEFLQKNEGFLKTSGAVLELAMMIETQALDLYLRFGRKMAQESTREILFQIAEEEKAHLAALGKLLDDKLG